MKILGMISGTSHDGIDAVLADFRLEGQELKASIEKTSSAGYEPQLRNRLMQLLPPNETTIEEVCKVDTLIGKAFANLAKDMLDTSNADLIVSHGQTVYHWVEAERALGTLQLGQAAWISNATSAPVLSDLRIADIASGGHGAPVVPVLDLLTLGHEAECVGSLNLGGIANITVIREGKLVSAYDTGPASALIDAAVIKYNLSEEGFDRDGAIAASGQVNAELLASFLSEDYYSLAAPKSTGKELFHVDYIDEHISKLGTAPSGQDVVATLTELTAETVSRELLAHGVRKLVVGGGGYNNLHLMKLIGTKTGLDPRPFSEYGISGDLKEALAMALIGWLSLHNLPATFSNTTGTQSAPVLGTLTAGGKGFPAIEAGVSMPSKMVITGG